MSRESLRIISAHAVEKSVERFIDIYRKAIIMNSPLKRKREGWFVAHKYALAFIVFGFVFSFFGAFLTIDALAENKMVKSISEIDPKEIAVKGVEMVERVDERIKEKINFAP